MKIKYSLHDSFSIWCEPLKDQYKNGVLENGTRKDISVIIKDSVIKSYHKMARGHLKLNKPPLNPITSIERPIFVKWDPTNFSHLSTMFPWYLSAKWLFSDEKPGLKCKAAIIENFVVIRKKR